MAEGCPGRLEGRTPAFPRRQPSPEPRAVHSRGEAAPRAAPHVKSVVTSFKVINS